MTGNDYQRAALRTSGTLDTVEQLKEGVMGLAGETGEVADIIKKALYQGHPLDREHLKEEIGDVIWYIALLCTALDVWIEDVMDGSIKKLSKRYPDGFDPKRSINRSF